jgi:hypothetical protein
LRPAPSGLGHQLKRGALGGTVCLLQDFGHTPDKRPIVAKAADLVGLIVDILRDVGKLRLELLKAGPKFRGATYRDRRAL